MKTIPIYFDGEIGAEELRTVLEAGGLHVRTLGGRLVASRIPPFLRREATQAQAPASNVVPIIEGLLMRPSRRRKVAR